jgi:hypothetical protein
VIAVSLAVLGVAGVGLLPAPVLGAGGGQTPAPVTLPEALRAHIRDEPIQIVTSIRGLPLGVRDALQRLFGGYALDIANPGEAFQGSGANPKLPLRRLVAAGCLTDHYCLVHYERGGETRTWYVALFHWTPDATTLEVGGLVPRVMASVEDVRKAILSGTIKGPPKVW